MKCEMICPFCGAELKEWDEWGTPVGLSCPNACKTRQIMDKEIWQALIEGKKARDYLKEMIKSLGANFNEEEEFFIIDWDGLTKIIEEAKIFITKENEND